MVLSEIWELPYDNVSYMPVIGMILYIYTGAIILDSLSPQSFHYLGIKAKLVEIRLTLTDQS